MCKLRTHIKTLRHNNLIKTKTPPLVELTCSRKVKFKMHACFLGWDGMGVVKFTCNIIVTYGVIKHTCMQVLNCDAMRFLNYKIK